MDYIGISIKTKVVNLLCEILCRLDGGLHPLDREEGREVGGVGADHDQGEEPPQRRDHSGGESPKFVFFLILFWINSEPLQKLSIISTKNAINMFRQMFIKLTLVKYLLPGPTRLPV